MKNIFCKIFIIVFLASSYQITFGQLTPQEAVQNITKGINLGNTLEPPNESGWNNGPAQEYYFDDYKNAGFTCVRIPVRWDEHTAATAPYNVTEAWMNRVEEIVDWGLSRDLYIILNAHHEEWIKVNYSEANKARFDSIWVQISERFKDKSEKLLFEIINEPKGLTVGQVDDLNERTLSIIRKTNPTRIVIYSGNEWSSLERMIAAKIPNDNFIIAYFHSYDPWNFGGLGNGTWGTSSDRNEIKSKFLAAANWSTTNNVPVIISEFGAVHKCDYNSRMMFYSTYVQEAQANNIPFQVWDDGGQFRVYKREDRTWPEVKDILIHTNSGGPTSLSSTLNSETSVTINWQNRTTENSKTIIQRKINNSSFIEHAELDVSTTTYKDTTISAGNDYYYRVISEINDSVSYYSYPIKIFIKPNERSSYLGKPFTIPGTIEAEDFDIGGEGLTYHDSESENIPNGYRPADGVDLEALTSGGFQIAYVKTGEWVEYTIDVEQAGDYDITAHTASLNGGGQIQFNTLNSTSGIIEVASTSSWQTTTEVKGKIFLDKGEQVLRLSMVLANPFNIDKFSFVFDTSTDVKIISDIPSEYALYQNYPNPFNPETTIKYQIPNNKSQINSNVVLGNENIRSVQLIIYNLLGREVATLVNENKSAGKYEVIFNASSLSSGVYYYKLAAGKFTETKKMIVLK
ncbi:MAG: cellulase family glycosylhydrolase [Melioribacteraceae bacterium]